MRYSQFKSDAQRKAVMARLSRRPNVRMRGVPNLKMNEKVYQLRRKVIDLIYEAKRIIPDLPRINIRITDNPIKKTLGTASLRPDEYVIWIPARVAINASPDLLRNIVYHEIAHTVYDAEHDESCPMMCKELDTTKPDTWLSKDKLQERLQHYARIKK